jgi:hypothetical protein
MRRHSREIRLSAPRRSRPNTRCHDPATAANGVHVVIPINWVNLRGNPERQADRPGDLDRPVRPFFRRDAAKEREIAPRAVAKGEAVASQFADGSGARCALLIETSRTSGKSSKTARTSGRSSLPCSVVTIGVRIRREYGDAK